MKKLASAILAALLMLSLFACATPVTIDDMVEKTYIYEKEGCGGSFGITLNADGTFSYYEGILSSYLGYGAWTYEDGILTLTDSETYGYGFVNRFTIEKDTLVFVADGSNNFLYVKVKDGERFTVTDEMTRFLTVDTQAE